MAKANVVEESSNETEEKRDKDRRYYESWLQDALELSLFERFCRREGLAEGEPHEPALILHGQRSGAHPDFALLDANRRLILVELKRGPMTNATASKTVDQMEKYAKDYATRTLGELAVWYCHHGVNVNTTFGYRGDGYIETKNGFEYGRLNRWSLNNLPAYRKGCTKPEAALEALRKDFAALVGASLELGVNDRPGVGRYILLAETWPEKFEPAIDGVRVELWTYPSPAQWVGPGRRRQAVPVP